ncbi:MAG: ribosome biogenesis GTPase Der, partial [Myxococcales bacterium]|nr:ribosome biogenesis GTPase Der [Myxococcales bacterium]
MSEFIPGLVAIIGRPNVGKSTLFNRLAKERVSIVEDTPGVTRDRIFRSLEWQDKPYILCDTGGLEPTSGDPILQAMRRQTQLAIDEADVVLFMVDGREGLNPADREVANLLRRADRPVVLAVNKTEARTAKEQAWEFTQLGFEATHFISSAHGQGIHEVM